MIGDKIKQDLADLADGTVWRSAGSYSERDERLKEICDSARIYIRNLEGLIEKLQSPSAADVPRAKQKRGSGDGV